MPQKKIILIDDDPDLLEVTRRRLEHEGYGVMTSNDSMAGLKLAIENKPDLIVMDIKMPKMDGWSLVRKLRTDVRTKEIPIIVLTGYEDMQDLFIAEGIYDYLMKPYHPEKLLGLIIKCFDGSE
ncbi:MAG: hypothetical protein A2Z83_06755 [Omnitrophica bacterium GWA2_52_8]|nr:MAG: hypothetical protein A2Z83_06755 [Omnitrophica bacterium GWA2_52_8]